MQIPCTDHSFQFGKSIALENKNKTKKTEKEQYTKKHTIKCFQWKKQKPREGERARERERNCNGVWKFHMICRRRFTINNSRFIVKAITCTYLDAIKMQQTENKLVSLVYVIRIFAHWGHTIQKLAHGMHGVENTIL